MSGQPRDNRLTIVPAIGVYSATEDEPRLRGKVGVAASNITCAPLVGDGERAFGEWSASDTALHALSDQDDRGPRSGEASEYEDCCLAIGRHRMLVTDTALLGAVEGRSVWGNSGGRKKGRLLVWKWDLADIHEIQVHRLRKAFKLWDVEFMITCSDPEARLYYTGLGEAAAPFRAVDKDAKAASVDGSPALGLASTIAAAVTARLGRAVERTQQQDGKDLLYTFRFPQAPVESPNSKPNREAGSVSQVETDRLTDLVERGLRGEPLTSEEVAELRAAGIEPKY